MLKKLNKFLHDERGASTIEYVLFALMVAIALNYFSYEKPPDKKPLPAATAETPTR